MPLELCFFTGVPKPQEWRLAKAIWNQLDVCILLFFLVYAEKYQVFTGFKCGKTQKIVSDSLHFLSVNGLIYRRSGWYYILRSRENPIKKTDWENKRKPDQKKL